MSSNVRFIHTADFHLGAPMRGFNALAEPWAARLQEAIVQAYDRVIDAALANEVDFVVIAGDTFDSSGASYGDFLHFFEGLQKLEDAGIPVYLTTGNHDPYNSWRFDRDRLPLSCHLMGGDAAEFALYERAGEPLCLVGARGYRNQAWPFGESIAQGIDRAHAVKALQAEYPRAAQAPFCIGIIHTGFVRDQSKAFSDSSALLAADVDYWACGHLHGHRAVPSAARPRIAFPGCIQGRDLKETGEHGCYLVELSEDGGGVSAELEFIPTASVVFHTIESDVSACVTLADVSHLVQAQLFHENGKAHCDEMVVRVELVGATNLHEYLRRPDVIRDLRKRLNNAYPSFFCDALVDRTRPIADRDAMLREGLFRAHALRVADEQRRETDQVINYVQAEFVKRGIDVPSALADEMAAFECAAETLVLDLLEEEEQ